MSMRMSGAPRGRTAAVTFAGLLVVGGFTGGVAAAISPPAPGSSHCGATVAHAAVQPGTTGDKSS